MALHLPAQTLYLARCLMWLNLLTKDFSLLVCNDTQTPYVSSCKSSPQAITSLQLLWFCCRLTLGQPQPQRSIFISTPSLFFSLKKSMQMMYIIGPLWFENTRARTRTHTR